MDASDRAISQGVRPGMSAAEGRAMCSNLICIDQDSPADRKALAALGRWMMRFTPDVAMGWDDADENAPIALFLDLTGCERLFGGIAPIVQQVTQSLKDFLIAAKIAVAPTPGAAWAFAFAGNGGSIATLPITSLRLDETILINLHRLGLHRIGDLQKIPREQLLSRFGSSLLLRLDQLTGDRHEPLTKLLHKMPVAAKMEFDAPIESVEEIGLIFEKLLDEILIELTRRHRGIRQLRMILKPDRGWGRPTITRTVILSRPHRHRRTLIYLLNCEMERVDCEHGFTRFQLDVPLHEQVADAQTQMFEPQSAEELMELEHLLQRLRARLGEGAVIHPELVESYLPERAWRESSTCVAAARDISRPLTLFRTPVEIRVVSEPSDECMGDPRQFNFQSHVYHLTQITGPERIAGEWWRGHNHTRDYYDVEDEDGQRFWIFRVTREQSKEKISARWFMHGRFD